MKTAGIVLDDWKLPIFKRCLDKGGFKYLEFNGPTKNCITLKVEFENITELQPIVQAANDEAAQFKRGKKRCTKNRKLH